MEISVKSMTLTCAIFWGACMLLLGLINLADPAYGSEFLRMMSSVYPGADTTRTVGRVLLGTLYGFVDGAIAGYIFALLYKFFARQHRSAH